MGPDAYFFDIITRAMPTHYWTVLSKLEGFAARSAVRRNGGVRA